jgi:hypothetical protein
MRRKVGTAAAVVGLVGAFAFVGPGQADSDFKNKYDSSESVHDCGDGSTITYNGPLKMWPPNHKMQDVSITAHDGDAEPATDDVTLTVLPAVDDAMGGDGGPQHEPDWSSDLAGAGTESVTVDFQLRSERSGKGDGRVYDVRADATFDNGLSSCSHTFQVLVPHDMRGGADWK